jgi:hypothetical protein
MHANITNDNDVQVLLEHSLHVDFPMMWQWQLCQDYRVVVQLKNRVTLAAVDLRSPMIECMQLRHDHSVLSHDTNPIIFIEKRQRSLVIFIEKN